MLCSFVSDRIQSELVVSTFLNYKKYGEMRRIGLMLLESIHTPSCQQAKKFREHQDGCDFDQW